MTLEAVYLSGILCWITYTDFKERIIPDTAHFLLIIYALTINFPNIKQNLIGITIGTGFMLLVSLIGPMGGGDIKLMGSLGAWFGFQIIDVFFLSYIVGAVIAGIYYLKYRNTRQEIPFGPSIALSALIIYFTNYPILYPYFLYILK